MSIWKIKIRHLLERLGFLEKKPIAKCVLSDCVKMFGNDSNHMAEARLFIIATIDLGIEKGINASNANGLFRLRSDVKNWATERTVSKAMALLIMHETKMILTLVREHQSELKERCMQLAKHESETDFYPLGDHS